jgi:SWI/SNF-related matrix-associated actin-dependent regulator 1 of chromatin subfamily A
MFFKHLEEEKEDKHPKMDDSASAKSKDLRDEFRNGLADAGLDVKAENVKEEADVKKE